MYETITLIANISLALSLIVAVVFGIAQVKAAERDRQERLTLEQLHNFQTREFAELIHFVTSHNLPANGEEFQALPHREQVIFIQMAQQMESLGILVAEGFINIDLVDKTLGSFVTTTWEKYKVFVLSRRKVDPFLNEYFQWLAKQIDDRMKNHPRPPFYETGPSTNNKAPYIT